MNNTSKPNKPKNLSDARTALRNVEKVLEKEIVAKKEADKEHIVALARLGHELKNPLNAISGFSEMMADKNCSLPIDAYREYSSLIHTAVLQTIRICERELLAFTEAGSREMLVREDVNAASLAEDMVKLFAKIAGDGGVKLKVDFPDDFPVMKTDPVRLHQVLSNTISNAVKFTPKGGEVEVKGMVKDDETLILVIADEGRGISPESLLLVAHAGYREGNDSDALGDGLGLNISERLMKEMGGTIDIQSKLGVGTVVSLIFPKASIS